MIFLLLMGGALAFVFASQITLGDLYPLDVDKKLEELRKERATLTSEREILTSENEKADEAYQQKMKSVRDAYDVALQKVGISGARVAKTRMREVPVSTFMTVGLKDLMTPALVAARLAERFPGRGTNDGPSRIAIVVLDRDENYVHVWEFAYEQKDEAMKVVLDLQVEPIAPPTEKSISPEKAQRLELLSAAMTRLQQQRTEQGLAALLGKSPAAPNEHGIGDVKQAEVPLTQLVQTNVTRFGTIVLIVFLVSILTPLYRYNFRLATYYDARADVLELFNTKLLRTDVVKMMAVFTPTFDFGKAPSTPIEQLAQLVAELTHGSSKKGRGAKEQT